MEKSKGLCRQITIPALQDLLILQRLSDALYADIKNKAPTKKSFFEPEDHSFSNTKKEEDGAPGYGSYRAWLNFQKLLLKFAEERNYVIVTDIANYYDTISYSHLRNVVSSQINIRETVLDTLIYVLSALLWQPDYMPRIEIGLPQINVDATRILAHCFLYELDEYLDSQKYDFTRFMDDVDIGVDTIVEAKRVLRDVDLILQTRQVRLNSGKTKILSKRDAQLHFCVRENHLLDWANKRIDKKLLAAADLTSEQRIVRHAFSYLYKKGTFDAGAGEKILKRFLTLARKTNAKLDDKVIRHILINKPSCRSSVLLYLTRKRLESSDVKTIVFFIRSKMLVDDVSILNGVEALVEADVPRNAHTDNCVEQLCEYLYSLKSFTGAYALIWLSSKYKDSGTVMKYLRLTFDIWRADALLGRLIGGILPLARMDGRESELRKLLDNAKNPDAYAVANFHDQLALEVKNVGAIRAIVTAANPTKPLGITHPKYLVLLSAVQNEHLTDKQKISLLKNHTQLMRNKYYRHRIVRSLPAKIRSDIFAKNHVKISSSIYVSSKHANSNAPPSNLEPKTTKQ